METRFPLSTTSIPITESVGTPLPDIPPPDVASNNELSPGYTIIKQLEATERAKPTTPKQKERLMYLRILAYLISHGPSLKARAAVARRIVDCKNEDEILREGEKFFNYYIRAFYKYRGPANTPSVQSSRSYENLQDMIKSVLIESPTNHSQAKKYALLRDGFRCPVTGWYDRSIKTKITQWKEVVGKEYHGVTLECAHIIPESTNANITDRPARIDQASNVWTILTLFGSQDIVDKLNGKNIHALENVLTLEHNVHDIFNRLDLWFEPTDKPKVYNVCVAGDRTLHPTWNRQVQFNGTEDLPAPSVEYLALHAACCRVAHMSGAADYIEQVLDEFESVPVLSSDGTSAQLLTYALAPFSQQVAIN